MEVKGLSNADIREACGCSRSRAYEIINGRRQVPRAMLLPLSRLLGIPIEQLL
jgi:plasmid maintenance system antidote protein VapI